MSAQLEPGSIHEMDDSEQPAAGHVTQGLDISLEGFKAIASIAGESPGKDIKWTGLLTKLTDDGRVDVNLHKERNACETAERFLHYMAGHDDYQAEDFREENHIGASKNPPLLNIVIQIVGSRGDVQPFIALGVELQKFGHRVRIATHPPFRNFVENSGLEFFSIGGDPKEMMAYMVKNPGLLPHMKSLHEGDVEKSRMAIRDILDGCWRSCLDTDESIHSNDSGQSADSKPFVANAIIANPPSFAHIHCAEKLGVPLHMMFTYGISHLRRITFSMLMYSTACRGRPHIHSHTRSPTLNPVLSILVPPTTSLS